jgi:phosphopentomutase
MFCHRFGRASCDNQKANKIIRTLDSFFSGILKTKTSSTNLLICSDHGNIEDLGVKSHTTNMVPLIVIGPDAHHFHL